MNLKLQAITKNEYSIVANIIKFLWHLYFSIVVNLHSFQYNILSQSSS